MKHKIKLIATDLDGTLLTEYSPTCSEEAITLITELTKKGVIFAPASGRQYFNLRNMFAAVDGDVMHVCENGALVLYKDQVILKRQFEKNLSLEICHMVLDDPECEILISGERTCYVIPRTDGYVDYLRNHIKNDVTVIDAPEDICEPIIKVSYFTPASHQKDATENFEKIIDGRCQIMVSGNEWADFAPHGTDKGTALAAVGEKMGILPEEMAAFGDNENDRAMLSFVGHPYLMDPCNPTMEDLKVNRCHRVEDVLREILESMD